MTFGTKDGAMQISLRIFRKRLWKGWNKLYNKECNSDSSGLFIKYQCTFVFIVKFKKLRIILPFLKAISVCKGPLYSIK